MYYNVPQGGLSCIIVSPWKAPGQQGIVDTHTRPPTDTALLQSHHSQTPGGHTHINTHELMSQ